MSTYSDGDMSFNGSNDALTVKLRCQPGELSFDLQGRAAPSAPRPRSSSSRNRRTARPGRRVLRSTTPSVHHEHGVGPYAAGASRYVRWTYVIKYPYNNGTEQRELTSGGAPVFTVSVDKTNGFTVAQGASDAITANARERNGTHRLWVGQHAESRGLHGGGQCVHHRGTARRATNSRRSMRRIPICDGAGDGVLLRGGGGGRSDHWRRQPGSTMFYATSNQNIIIILPTNYNLTAVYGTDPSAVGLNNLGKARAALTPGVDYTWTPRDADGQRLSGVTNRRVLRIGASSP
jgi:hypothetical protein